MLHEADQQDTTPSVAAAGGSQSERSTGDLLNSGAWIFAHLPSDIQQRVLSKLGKDTPALRSFCYSSRTFANMFRDAFLWRLLCVERWGKATIVQNEDSIGALRDRFVMRVDAELLREQQQHTGSQALSVTYQNLAAGAYQVLIHTTPGLHISTASFQTSVTGPGLAESQEGTYYEPMYINDFHIAIAVFKVEIPCDVLFTCSQSPSRLDCVQLKQVEQGQLLKVSPQWQKVHQSNDDEYPSNDTAVGREQNHAQLWLALRMGSDRQAQVGKIGPHLGFHYAQRGSFKEQMSPYVLHSSAGSVYPGILVNTKDFAWVTTTLSKAHTLLEHAVPLVSYGSIEGQHTIYGARVNFCGWKEYRGGHPEQYTMKTHGRIVSVVPGKLEVHVQSGHLDAIFTWGGKTTSRYPLHATQSFELLCYKLYKGGLSI